MTIDLGKVAYEAWVVASGKAGVTIRKSWDEILEDERGQWRETARAVADAFWASERPTNPDLENPE
jgi:hypothetical protein